MEQNIPTTTSATPTGEWKLFRRRTAPDLDPPVVCTEHGLVRLIPLTRGLHARIDEADFPSVGPYVWSTRSCGSSTYACRGVRNRDTGKYEGTLMHRWIMKAEIDAAPRGLMVDHIDGDGLNNTRRNLRLVTPQENRWNQRKQDGTTSRYMGVSWERARLAWSASILIDGNTVRLGTFATEEEAAFAWDEVAKRHRGKFARLNFPDRVVS